MSRAKVAFVVEDINTNHAANQTTWVLMQEAQNRGYDIFWMEPSDLHLHHNSPVGYMSPVQIQGGMSPQFVWGESVLVPLSKLDLVFWRQPTPHDWSDVLALELLQLATKQTVILNHPSALRGVHSQLFALQYPELVPASLITKNPNAVEAFLHEMGGKAVIQSLHQSGLQKNFFLRIGDPNLNTLIESLTQQGQEYVFLQKMVSEPGLEGDKRLFLLQGELLGAVLQVPAAGELRGAFERQAQPAVCKVNSKDMAVARTVGTALREQGVFFASVDVCQGQIIDLNLSCPGGLAQLQQVSERDVISPIFDAIERL